MSEPLIVRARDRGHLIAKGWERFRAYMSGHAWIPCPVCHERFDPTNSRLTIRQPEDQLGLPPDVSVGTAVCSKFCKIFYESCLEFN